MDKPPTITAEIRNWDIQRRLKLIRGQIYHDTSGAMYKDGYWFERKFIKLHKMNDHYLIECPYDNTYIAYYHTSKARIL